MHPANPLLIVLLLLISFILAGVCALRFRKITRQLDVVTCTQLKAASVSYFYVLTTFALIVIFSFVSALLLKILAVFLLLAFATIEQKKYIKRLRAQAIPEHVIEKMKNLGVLSFVTVVVMFTGIFLATKAP